MDDEIMTNEYDGQTSVDDFDLMVDDQDDDEEKWPIDNSMGDDSKRQKRFMRSLRYAFGNAHRAFAREDTNTNLTSGESRTKLVFNHSFPELNQQYVLLINPRNVPGFAADDPDLSLTMPELIGKAMEQIASIGKTDSVLLAIRSVIITLLYMLRLPEVRDEFRRTHYVQKVNADSFADQAQDISRS